MLNLSSLPRTSLLALTLAASLLVSGAANAQIVFTDVTSEAGVALSATLNESVAWGDVDNDGDSDLYLTNNAPNVLLRNDGVDGFGFPIFTDITTAAGVGDGGFSVGAAFGDLDNDGDSDLYVVSFGVGPDVLYRNDSTRRAVGPGPTFTNVTVAAGINDETSSRGVALVDFDHDGLLDIYVNAIGSDILYRNLGNLTFTNVAATAGVDTNTGQGVGVVATDLNDDGWIDIFTGNRSFDPNRLFMNMGDGTFSDITDASNITETGLGMGVCAFDIDNDLDSDLYWTAWPGADVSPQPNALYENLGPVGAQPMVPIFDDATSSSGTEDALGWGISCNAGDIDNDGFEDIAITNGFDPSTTPNVLFHNQGDGTFADVTNLLENGADYDGRGVAFADFDLDGDVDMILTGGPTDDTRMWRNDSITNNHWLTVRLLGTVSNRSAIGARAWIETANGTVMREVSGGAGRGSQNDLPIEIGLGSATDVLGIRVRWPSGLESVLTDLEADQRLAIDESLVFANGFERGDASAWDLIP